MNRPSFPLLEAVLFLTLIFSESAIALANQPVAAISRHSGGDGAKRDSADAVVMASDPIRSSDRTSPRSKSENSESVSAQNESRTVYGTGVWESGFAGLAVPSSYYSGEGAGMVIQGIEVFPNNQLYVFNSMGKRVYSQRGYANGWAGTDREGNLLPSGTYFILVEIDGLGDDVQAYVKIQH